VREQEHPFYLRFGVTLLTIALIVGGIYVSKGIILPFFFSILLSSLLMPFYKWLENLGLGRFLSITIPITLAVTLFGALIYFFYLQISGFMQDIPELKLQLGETLEDVKRWIQSNLGISIWSQNQYIEETTRRMKTNSPEIVEKTFFTITEGVSYFIFLPIYSFLLLYHKDTIRKFFMELSTDGNSLKVREILYEAQVISRQYITGLMIEMGLVFTMNCIGFLLLGLKYPFFLALVAAILNVVPYVGMLIANIFCSLIALTTTGEPATMLWVVGVLGLIQIIDNNILMPLIVGTKVRLNALAIILGVLTAGAVAGIAGMFLAIPVLAVTKLVFERVDSLKPWAILIGDERGDNSESKNIFHRTLFRTRQRKEENKSENN